MTALSVRQMEQAWVTQYMHKKKALVIVGPVGCGKTQWLRSIRALHGDVAKIASARDLLATWNYDLLAGARILMLDGITPAELKEVRETIIGLTRGKSRVLRRKGLPDVVRTGPVQVVMTSSNPRIVTLLAGDRRFRVINLVETVKRTESS